MTSFKEFLTEGYKNLFTSAEKQKYAEEAYAQLISSYEGVGGIHGSGFKSIDDFIERIPFWKLKLKNGRIIAASYYKDNNGRKRVAVSSDGSEEGKKALAEIMVNDIMQERSYGEQSGPALSFLAKNIGYDLIKKYAIPKNEMQDIIGDDIYDPEDDDPEVVKHPELKDFFYKRYIGGKLHTKMAIGTIGKRIVK